MDLKKYTKKQLADKIAVLENESANKLEALKKRIESRKGREREEVITALFSLYETVLLEDKWNDRIHWKNQITEEIQYLIRYIGQL